MNLERLRGSVDVCGLMLVCLPVAPAVAQTDVHPETRNSGTWMRKLSVGAGLASVAAVANGERACAT